MIRTLGTTIIVTAMLAGCAGPVATRIDSRSAEALPEQGRYMLAEAPGDTVPMLDAAQQQVIASLSRQGWQHGDETADYMLLVTLSERSAAIGLKAVGDDTARTIATPKEQEFLQSCEDVEHRLTISLLRQSDGSTAYNGSAAEHHCKAGLAESMPHLVAAALADFGRPGGQRVVHRKGVE
ncbi:MAG: hypothetical protein AAFX04_02535 [Pseudomonadota bacterium]